MGAEWAHNSLRHAWWTLQRDPVRILLPSAGALLLELAVAIGLRSVFPLVELGVWLELWAASRVFVVLAQSPFRASMLRAGAEAMNQPSGGVARFPHLAAVSLVIQLLYVLATAALAVPALVLAFWLWRRGLDPLAGLVLGVGVTAGTLLGLFARSLFAYAPIEAVVHRKNAFAALRDGFRAGGGDRVGTLLVLFGGDLAFGVGGALCGAGALPGYPLGDLAILHRWTVRSPEVS